MAPATLYIADGHHRFETAAAYAEERRAAEPDAPEDADFAMTLVYASAADDPVLDIWPTHRLVKPAEELPATVAELAARLGGDGFIAGRRPDLTTATDDAHQARGTHHAFGVLAGDGAALLTAPRERTASPSASLDVAVLADRVLARGLGITPDAIAGGALFYTRDVAEA